jgi:hypothetical protein
MDAELKAALIREVTEAVREHVDTKTTTAIDDIWKRGQRAMQALQKQQISETAKLQAALASCTDAHRQIEQENKMLHQGLDALVKHLTQAFGVPPAMQPPASDPAQAAAVPAAQSEAAVPASAAAASGAGAADPAALAAAAAAAPAGTSGTANELEAAATRGAATASSSGASSDRMSHCSLGPAAVEALPTVVAAATPSTVPTFVVPLRRADNVPLGLDLDRGDGSGLTVLSVRPGGAVEAWNRQCAGDSREIRAGDRIIKINDVEDPEGMTTECRTKHLVRLTLQRAAVAASVAAGAGMRADAFEFVPGQAVQRQ